jgi:hypothetical protein
MKGYVARKGGRWYAVIYEGLDQVTGRERRSWYPAGTVRADAACVFEQLVAPATPPASDSRENTRLKRREKTS